MSKLLLCVGKRSEIPFNFLDSHVNLYSIEEISYYIYSNIYSITDEMLDYKLVNFLYEQLEMKFLAGRIEALIKNNSLMEEKIMAIMASSNFYTQKELEEFRKKVNSIGNLSLEERLKFRGDSYLKSKYYLLAIRQYLDMLNTKANPLIDKDIYSKAWHNLGVAYMRVFLFEEAVEAFKSAYDIKKEKMFIESYLKALKISKMEDRYEEVMKEIDVEIQENWENQWETLLDEKGKMKEPMEDISGLIDKWKQEYRAQMI